MNVKVPAAGHVSASFCFNILGAPPMPAMPASEETTSAIWLVLIDRADWSRPDAMPMLSVLLPIGLLRCRSMYRVLESGYEGVGAMVKVVIPVAALTTVPWMSDLGR